MNRTFFSRASRSILRHGSGHALHTRLAALLIALNLIVSSAIATHKLEPFADLATYYQEAQMLARGQGFTQPIKINVHTTDTEPPYATSDRFIYPIIIALALPVFGDSLATANLVAAVSMALIALPLYLLGCQLGKPRAAFWATVLFAFNPFYHVIGIQGWTDSTATLFYYACLATLASYALAPTQREAWLSGLWFALAVLTREENLLLSLPLLVVWWWKQRQHTLAFAIAPLLGFFARAAYLQLTFGNPFYSERSYFFLPRWGLWYYLGAFTPTEYLDYVGGVSGALGIRLYNLLRFGVDNFSDGLLYFTDIGMLPLTLLIGVAVAWRLRHQLYTIEQRRVWWLCAGLFGLQIVVSLCYPGYIDNGQAVRHGSVAAPFIFLAAANGLNAWWETTRRARVLVTLIGAHYALFALMGFGLWGANLVQPDYRGPVVLAALWAREQLPNTALLMTRRAAETHYFSGKYVVVTPSAPFTETLLFARAHHVTHFLITDVERSATPNLLQGIRAYPQYFQVVYSTAGAQIVAIQTNDDFAQLRALPNELYAGKTTGRPDKLYEWSRLLPNGMGSLFELLPSAWSEIFVALQSRAAATPAAQALNVRAGDTIALMRYELGQVALARGDDVQLTLHWRALASAPTNYTVFAHLLDADGILRAQKDAQPLHGARPTGAWQVGEWLEDHYSFVIPNDAPTGAYRLAVGLYDGVTGKRLPLFDAMGKPLADDRLLIEGLTVK